MSDVAAALAAEDPGFIVVDTRSDASWAQGHVPGAMHLPGRRIADEAPGRIPAGTPVVVYCWGPGCNGATRAALEFARLGYPVKEMLGGFEYWVREGFAYDTDDGVMQRPADALTNVGRGGARRCAAAGGCGRRDQLRLLTRAERACTDYRSGPRRLSSHSVCSRSPLRTAALMMR